MYVYVYIILHCVITPKAGEQSPTPYVYLEYYLRNNSNNITGSMRQALATSQGNHSSHCTPAAWETLLAQRAHCFGSSSELPWHTNLVPPAPLPGTPIHKETFPQCNPQPHWPRGWHQAAAHSAQEALRDGGINSPCPQSSGLAWELRSLLSTRHLSEQLWFQPEKGTITYTSTPFAPCSFTVLWSLHLSHVAFGTEFCNGEVLQATHLLKTSAVLLSQYWQMLTLCRLQLLAQLEGWKPWEDKEPKKIKLPKYSIIV